MPKAAKLTELKFSPLAVLSCTLLLAACGPAGTEEPAVVAPPPVETPAPAPTEEATPFVPVDPDRLTGLTPKDVVSLMGEPGLMRRDGPVQVMLFENHSCVVEIVFMEPDPDAHFQADHVTARDRDGNDTDLQACLTQLLPDGQWPDQR